MTLMVKLRRPLKPEKLPGLAGAGKFGGTHVIYYWYSDVAPIYALLAYGKNEKTDLNPSEAKAAAAFAKASKAAYRSKA